MPSSACSDLLAIPWTVGPVTFAAPTVLWGALAALGPVLIHLIMRSKPQQTPLPTVRFVLKTHQQTHAMQKLKHLLLLVLRTLAILLLVAALARPTLQAGASSAGARGPVKAVICMDDSASMDYRSQARSRFEQAREMATGLLKDRSRFPPGSRVALLTGSRAGAVPRLSLDVDYVRQQVEQLEVGEHDQGVGGMLDRAYSLLADGVLQTREVYLLGDLTQHSWRDVPPRRFTAHKEVQVYCIDVGAGTDTNFAILDVILPDRTVAAGAAVRIRTGIQAGQIAGPRQLEARVDGKVLWRAGPIELQPGQVIQQVIELANLGQGLHQGEVRLTPEDPLSADNIRYFTLSVGAIPKAAVVCTAGGEAAEVVCAMLAPDGLPADRRRVELARMAPTELAAVTDVASCSAIFLVDVPSVDEAVFAKLGEYVAAGGCLVVIPGPAMVPAGYQGGQAVLAALPVEVVVPARPLHVAPLDKAHPLLARFQNGSGLSLSEPVIRRYVRFGAPLGSGEVVARLEDGSPGIVLRRIDRGSSVALAFAPVREWGDWAIDAGPLLVLLNSIIAESPGRDGLAGNFRVGQAVRLSVPRPQEAMRSKDRRALTVLLPGFRQSVSAAVDPDSSTIEAITERCGHYRVGSDGPDKATVLAYSVNLPSEESRLDRFSREAIEIRFAPGTVRVVRGLDELTVSHSPHGGAYGLSGWFALVLLGLLMAEGLLSNRFYRRPERDNAPSSVPGPQGSVE